MVQQRLDDLSETAREDGKNTRTEMAILQTQNTLLQNEKDLLDERLTNVTRELGRLAAERDRLLRAENDRLASFEGERQCRIAAETDNVSLQAPPLASYPWPRKRWSDGGQKVPVPCPTAML